MTRYVLVKRAVETKQVEQKSKPEVDRNEHEMLVGKSMDSEHARDRWIDTVEKILENESLEDGKKHSRKNFDTVRYDGNYLIEEPPRWML